MNPMPSSYTRACAAFLFPLHERIKGHDTMRIRRRLERSQWWKEDELRAYQIERLRAFLTDIGRRVPYYRDLFGRIGFDPARVATLADLGRLPLLGKPEIRSNRERIKAEGAKRKLAGIEIEGARIEMNAVQWRVKSGGDEIGRATSAIYSPRLKKNIGYAMVPVKYATPGTELRVKIPGVGERRATVVPRPFIDPKKEIPKA